MQRVVFKIALVATFLGIGLERIRGADPSSQDPVLWKSWKQRKPISLSFRETQLKEVVEEFSQQVDMPFSPLVSALVSDKVISGNIRNVSSWQALAEIARLADVEITVMPQGSRATLLCFGMHWPKSSIFRQCAFAGPFCFELARLGATVNPEEIRNTWRLRSLGFCEDGETFVDKIIVTDKQTRKVTNGERLRLSNHSGDIIRTIGGGTYDNFFKLPEQIERHGFSCKVSFDSSEVSKWTWVRVPLRKGTEVRADDVTIKFEEISEKDGDIKASYRMRWPIGISEEALKRRKKIYYKIESDETVTPEERRWLKANQDKVMTIRDLDVPSPNKDRPVRIGYSQEHSSDEPELFGTISVQKTAFSGEISNSVVRLQIAEVESVEREVSFDVPAIDKSQDDATSKPDGEKGTSLIIKT